MSISTTELLNQLTKADDVKQFIDKYKSEFLALTCTEFLNELLVKNDLSLSAVVKRSGQSDYVYKVFRGERKPSRDIMISIAVGMCLTLNEAQLLLRIAKLAALDPRDKRDSVIIYGINERLDAAEINDLLYELNEATL